MTAQETKTDKKYIEAVGRRKTAIARVRIFPAAKNSYLINNREIQDYFPTRELQNTATDAVTKSKTAEKFKITAMLKGGGISAQAEALRHGIARAITEHDEEMRKRLKKLGFLKRDARTKERRKFGLKKARKSPQWSKR